MPITPIHPAKVRALAFEASANIHVAEVFTQNMRMLFENAFESLCVYLRGIRCNEVEVARL